MKLINKIQETANNKKEMEMLLTVVYETVENEVIEYDALDKYIHMVRQIKAGEELTQAPRIATNFDFTDDATLRLIDKKVFEIADFLLANMEVEDFSDWIKDFDRVEFEAQALVI
ncbi:hypothetical protein MKR37_04380 [Staphylococcus haemolyticus]|uniref:hypothetical protein n=1 Tax=Staphylococcus haemolyticus TaxID=1283 RepID=UPI001F0A72D1|nr:hypothetical protein [Staphylococcus haemolyticus]MCH4482951.1 hypothetical protein [Staphylococcus haemolyticus]MDU0485424.1 hypothetical protein [Staphylococcus haemolyticus]